MLAQNFLSAEALGLSEAERDALIKVLGMLERGEIDDAHFDMGVFKDDDRDCGSVGCLCGWAYMVSYGEAFPELAWIITGSGEAPRRLLQTRLSREARELFAFNRPVVWDHARVKHAIPVLRDYLTKGKVRWSVARDFDAW